MGVFNNAATLPAALESILSQEGVELEFIVVDDGSTDGSAAILDETARKDARLKVVHQKNEGLTRALIGGCALASAPWIARQDADDVSLPGRLAALLDLARRQPGTVLLASAAWCMGPKGERLRLAACTPDPALARKQVLDLRIGPPAHGSTMFSRAAYEAVGGYRACFYYGQDSDLWMRLAERGGVAYLAEPHYAYRWEPGAISGAGRSLQRKFGRWGQACRRARAAGRSEEPWLRAAARLADGIRSGRVKKTRAGDRALGLYHAGCLLERTDPAAACAYFRQALAADPLCARARLKLWLNRRRG
jgi:glycosyltransferase involved in cell wall biosynthesis